jgi:hypothetical protein
MNFLEDLPYFIPLNCQWRVIVQLQT